MARIRSLKPEFWTDSKVVGIKDPWARMFFQGMWNFAICDSGHVEDDALALKLKILPAEIVDADQLLADVLESGMVVRRRLPDGRSYLHVLNLATHSKVENRWSPRCPYCNALNSPNLSEPRGSSGGVWGDNSGSPEDRKGGDRRGEEEEKFSSESADADPDANTEDDSNPPTAAERPDVEQICRLLVQLMVEAGHRKPYVTKAWRTEARLLLDKDGVDLLLAERVMRWALNSRFWRPNIKSMGKFREQFHTLRMQRQEQHEKAQGKSGPPGQRPTSEGFHNGVALHHRLAEQEAEADTEPQLMIEESA